MSEIAAKAGPALDDGRPRWLGLVDLLRVARVGLMVSHLWAYLLPALAAGLDPSWRFWIGALYVTVPLGLLIYGWNDYFDADVDALSRRKSDPATAAVFGPRLGDGRRAALPRVILVAQLPFAILWAATGQLVLVGWLAVMAAGNWLYNGPGPRMSRVPVAAELTATGIYLLIVWLGALVQGATVPLWMWIFATLSILALQIAGTLVDREDDVEVGKRTLSVAFGAATSRAALVAILVAKVALTWVYTGQALATGVMVAGLMLVAIRASVPGWRASSTAYSSFIVVDWIWLGLLLAG